MSAMPGVSHSDWKDACDEKTLTPELQLYQDVMQIVMINKDIRVSRIDCDKIVFYHHYDNELHVKEISPEDLVTKICRVWADIKVLMCFINWEHEPKCIFKRIIKIHDYKSYSPLFDEGEDYKAGYKCGKYTVESIVPEWGVKPFDAIKYCIEKDRNKVHVRLNTI